MNENPYDSPFQGSAEQRALYEYNIGVDCILPMLERWGLEVEGLRVLDLGCGSGGLAIALARSGAECWGIDLKAERIAEAVKMAANYDVSARFVVGNILEMNDFEQAFDLVILSETVEHLEKTSKGQRDLVLVPEKTELWRQRVRVIPAMVQPLCWSPGGMADYRSHSLVSSPARQAQVPARARASLGIPELYGGTEPPDTSIL